jgi:hypothetical protein
MAEYGSLFLLHLRLEGKRLRAGMVAADVDEILASLPNYKLASRDILGFAAALDDVEWSLQDGGDVDFELGVIATVVRHCSILATYLGGEPRFDRNCSIPMAFGLVEMHALGDEALHLYRFRLAQSRGLSSPEANHDLAGRWLAIARQFVTRVGGLVC